MTDLSEESLPEWTEDELALLRTADADRPSPRSLPAALTAVSAGATVVTLAAAAKGTTAVLGSSSAVTTAKAAGSFVLVKWAGAVVLAGAVVTGGAVIVQRAQHEKAAIPAGADRVSVPSPPPPAVRAASPPPEPALSIPPVAVDEPVPPGAPQVAAGAVEKGQAVRAQPDISQEIAALDEARKLLRGGRPNDALSALDRYDTRYARAGSLRIEASTLRIEALLQSGNRARATTLANAFLARHPKSPYAARVRALIAEPAPR